MEKVLDEKIFETQDMKRTTADGFASFAARLGISPRGQWGGENLLSKGFYEFNLLTRNRSQLEAAYRGSWIAGKVVDCVAEDMTRSGILINTNEGAEDVQEIQREMSRLQILGSLCNNTKWGRLYGGSIGVFQIAGDDLSAPLDVEAIQRGSFKGIACYDRWQLNPLLTEIIDFGPDIGLPKRYEIVLGSNLNDPGLAPGVQESKNSGSTVYVHHTRCIRSIGILLPFFQAITEMMWGESILERLWDRLISYDTATLSTASLVQRANLRTVGIDGLREILAAGGKAQESLVAQFEYMRQFQNNEGITLLDKNDTFESTAYSFAGLSDVMLQFGQQLAGACDIPLVRLFGQSPAGLSATGESDMRMYYDMINAKQENQLRNPMESILKVLWMSVIGKPMPSDLAFTFTPLWQMSAIDKANIAKINTDTILEAHQGALIDTPTAMKELKLASSDNGLFTHITDEQIEEAENELPPMPEETPTHTPETPTDPSENSQKPEISEPELKKSMGDSILKKMKSFFNGA